METSILRIDRLEKKYETFALQNISFEMPRGSIMGFIGQNGAGKSTTIKSILNIIPFDGGTITVKGMDSVRDEIKVKEIIGYVGENANLYGEVKARQLYKFVKKFYAKWDDAFFFQLAEQFRLDLNKQVNDFSKGTRVKLALAFALAHHPELLVLDEPTSGLDPVVRNELLDILVDIVKTEGSSVFFSSHITEDITKIADFVTYIDNGQILLSETKKNVLGAYKDIHTLDEILMLLINDRAGSA